MQTAVFRRILTPVALSLMLLTLWGITHRFHGLSRDGELYAFQAMAQINPSLRADLYLRNASQDDYSIFSYLYAGLIKGLGLQNAQLLLFVSCTLFFYAAAWKLTRVLSNSRMAWLSAGMLVVTAGFYGGAHIFSYAEPYLTARSMAEGLAVAAIALHFAGYRWAALCIAVATLFVHPLMALPALLLLIALWIPLPVAIGGAGIAVLTAFALPLAASLSNVAPGFIVVMDLPWLEVVQERSHFLLLNHWDFSDWEVAARPFVCLTLTALALPDDTIRMLCTRAMLVGFTGLLVAYAASAISPVALLLQGQAWRWMWIASFASVILLAPSAWRIWQNERVGSLCATLLVAGWACPEVDGLLCVDAALLLWLIRDRITERTTTHLRWTAYTIIAALAGWAIFNCWTVARSPMSFAGAEFSAVARVREVFALGTSSILFLGAMAYCMSQRHSLRLLAAVCVVFLPCAILVLKGSMTQLGTVGTQAEIDQFEDWRSVIPPSATVLIVPTGKSAAFAWFTLGRPSYISVDQSAGVVFSRATALEVRRRSEVLRPLADPSWQILSHIRDRALKGASTAAPLVPAKPLTAASLAAVCSDGQLDFVIAEESVGFEPVRHRHIGGWKDWNLYDCRRVRAAGPAA